MIYKVFFDSNDGDEIMGYDLGFDRSLEDIKKMGSHAREGAIVLLYMPNELEVEAELKFDPNSKCWRGIPIAPFRDVSE
jgi:hypothetical protein